MWKAGILVVMLSVHRMIASVHAGDGATSKAVEKDGLSVSIGVVSRQVNADEQPILKIRFENTSRKFMPLYDVNSYAKWRVEFTKVDAPDGATQDLAADV